MSLSGYIASKIFTKNPIVQGLSGQGGSNLSILANSGATTSRSASQLLKTYSESPWLRAAVSKISYTTATTPWRIYVASDATGKKIKATKIQKASIKHRKRFLKEMQGKGELVEIHDHPLLDLLSGGNEFLTGLANFQTLQQHSDLVGEGFLLKERNGLGKPSTLWAIPPIWVKRTPAPGYEFFLLTINGIETEIPMSEMLWFKDPNPADPFGRGSGISQSLADELSADEHASKHIADFFYNGARPDILVTAEDLNKGDTERLETAWNSRLKGFFKNHKTFFLNKKVNVHEMHTSFRDAQMLELRKFERDTIIQVFGIPPEIMGIVESSNRATIEGADYIFASKVIVPRLEAQRAVFQERLVPEFDDRIILDYESPVAEDKAFTLEVMQATPYAFELDEMRELGGLADLPDDQGKVRMVPFNLTTADTVENASAVDGNDIIDEDNDNDSTDPIKNKKSVIKALTNSEIEILVNEVNKDPFVRLVIPVVEQTAIEFGQDTIDEAGVDAIYDNLDPKVNDFIQTQTGQRFDTLVDETTKNKLRDELREGISLNETEGQLAKRIQTIFDDATDSRARMIARTETVRASNFGNFSGMKQVGVETKEWLSSRDSRVRDSHGSLDGTTIPINAKFMSPNTGATTDFPGDFHEASEDINCRCSVLSVFDEKSMKDLDADAVEKIREARWKALDNNRLPFERIMLPKIKQAFREQEAVVLDKFEEVFRSNP